MTGTRRVAVVGGGISGLATAYFLRQRRDPPEVLLIEADHRLGGKIRTHDVEGLPVDTGPDGFLIRAPRMRALVDELGLSPALAAPATARSYLWSREALRPLPSGAAFGIPRRVLPLLRSRLLSPVGLARAGLDLVLPATELPGDPSVAEVVRPRFGTQLLDRLVGPLVGGVYAGQPDRLSARSATPDVAALARRSRSLYLGLRRTASPASGPAFMTVDGGLGRLVDALADRLADIRLGSRVSRIDRGTGGYRLRFAVGNPEDVNAVVLAVPAFTAADLLAPLSPEAALALGEIPYADVASVTLAYPRAALRRPLDGTGFLTPAGEGRLIVGCTWLPAKWAHLDDSAVVLLRCLVGRHGDTRWRDLDDDTLAARVHRELAEAMDLTAGPERVHIQRWPAALPQYTIGHQDRLDRIDAGLRSLPGIHVTGAAYHGVGLAACVTQAEQVAAEVFAATCEHAVAADGAADAH
ncbi:protoporphyrinogen oxidase [Amycolatopsis sp. MtRt-6]|uniref:protoporphyrinogen oxidase n=1 Tax=Amycolatopsis sp. MtRt-6 TaxID=2792782 RepID=UPI001A905168|nr:protoporphyrinogen oxidase [Amycolatopsis sp. MtRt-6]